MVDLMGRRNREYRLTKEGDLHSLFPHHLPPSRARDTLIYPQETTCTYPCHGTLLETGAADLLCEKCEAVWHSISI